MAGHPRAHSFVSTHRKEDRVLLLASRYYAFVRSRSLFFLLFLLVWRHTHVFVFSFFFTRTFCRHFWGVVCLCVLLLLVFESVPPPEKKKSKKRAHTKKGLYKRRREISYYSDEITLLDEAYLSSSGGKRGLEEK